MILLGSYLLSKNFQMCSLPLNYKIREAGTDHSNICPLDINQSQDRASYMSILIKKKSV